MRRRETEADLIQIIDPSLAYEDATPRSLEPIVSFLCATPILRAEFRATRLRCERLSSAAPLNAPERIVDQRLIPLSSAFRRQPKSIKHSSSRKS